MSLLPPASYYEKVRVQFGPDPDCTSNSFEKCPQSLATDQEFGSIGLSGPKAKLTINDRTFFVSGGAMKLQLLLHPDRRSPDAIAEVRKVAQSLGITPTTEGAATISADVDPNTFQTLFGMPPDENLFSDPVKSLPLPVPESLRSHVQSISVAPIHIYMKKPTK